VPRGELLAGWDRNANFARAVIDAVVASAVKVEHDAHDIWPVLRHAHVGDASPHDAVVRLAAAVEAGARQIEHDAVRIIDCEVTDVDWSSDRDDNFRAAGRGDDTHRRDRACRRAIRLRYVRPDKRRARRHTART
jgi:hypothetical protein